MLPVPSYYYNGKKTRPDDEPHLRVSADIHPTTFYNVREILRMMQRERTRNTSLEKAREDKKRSNPDNADPDNGKKRVTIRDALSEIDMFQTEHLKLREFVQTQQRLIGNLHKRVKWLESTLSCHLQMDGSSAPSVESISSAVQSLGSLKDEIEEVPEEKCTCCLKVISVCKCFDD